MLFYTRQNLTNLRTQQAVRVNGCLALRVLKKTGHALPRHVGEFDSASSSSRAMALRPCQCVDSYGQQGLRGAMAQSLLAVADRVDPTRNRLTEGTPMTPSCLTQRLWPAVANQLHGLAFAACLCFGASGAAAAPVVFEGADNNVTLGGSYANSDAAAGNLASAIAGAGQTASRIDFESQPLGPFTSLALGNGVTAALGGALDSVIVSGISSANPTSNLTFNTTRPAGQRHVFLDTGNGAATLTFTFASAIDAFGIYLTGLDTQGQVSFAIDDGQPFSATRSGPPAGGLDVVFLGVSDFGQSFSQVTLTLLTAQYGVGFDDLVYSRVPEPGSLVLAAVALSLVRRASARRGTT